MGKGKKEVNVRIGENIHKAREAAGLTQESFSELIDVSVQYVSDLERGVVGTSVPTLVKICEALHVSSDYILFGTSENREYSHIAGKLSTLNPSQKKLLDESLQVALRLLHYTDGV